MPKAERRSQVTWEGNLMQGHGSIVSTSRVRSKISQSRGHRGLSDLMAKPARKS